MTAAHFFDICRLMKVVGFNETPAELSRQQLTDRRFTSTRNSENDYHHGPLVFLRPPIFSTANATTCRKGKRSSPWLASQWCARHVRVADLHDNESDSERNDSCLLARNSPSL